MSIRKVVKGWFTKKTENIYKGKMVFAFASEEGERFYTFPAEIHKPLNRFIKVNELLERMNAGVSGQELENILVVMESAIYDGLKDPKNSAKVASCVNLLRLRKGDVIHKDILLNLAAVLLIGENENQFIINQDYHQHKLDLFSDMVDKDGPHAFFLKSCIEPLLPLTNMSPNDLLLLWETNVARQRQLQVMLDNWI